MERTTAFDTFQACCATEGLLTKDFTPEGEDISSGIQDDATLLRFLRARNYVVDKALEQYKATRAWRNVNELIELYDSVDVDDYEGTRKIYPHWTGRRDDAGSPICLFEVAQLTPAVMAAYKDSCSSRISRPTSTEPESMLRLFCTYENLIRFLMPLCTAIQSRPNPGEPISHTTCIIDVSGVSLLNFWRLRTHMQVASVLATAHYPETLGRTYIVGAPAFFPTIWTWISKWFDAHTVSKIRIVPHGQECSALSETINPINIPHKYGGQHQYTFGSLPDLDPEITKMVKWLNEEEDGKIVQDLPKGPVKWVKRDDGTKVAIATGTVNGEKRVKEVMALP